MSGRRAEHYRHHQIPRRKGCGKDFGIHIRIKDAFDHGNATKQESKPQHTPGKPTGNRKKQQRQTEELFLFPVCGKRQQHSDHKLHRCRCQKFQSRQEYSNRINTAQQCCHQISAAPKWNPRKASGNQKQEIVHYGIQHKHTVHIHHRHCISPFPLESIIGHALRKIGRKKKLPQRLVAELQGMRYSVEKCILLSYGQEEHL